MRALCTKPVLVMTLVVLVVAICPAVAEWENYPATELLDEVSALAECLLVEEPPMLDGVADEPFWASVRAVTAWINPVQYRNHTTPVPMEARFAYDRQNVYVYFETAPVPEGLDLPAPSAWSLSLTLDPRPDHINTPELRFNADGSATLSISTWKQNFREEECKRLPQPHGKTLVSEGRLHGEFAIPIAGLMADPPEPGDAWDLDMRLQVSGRALNSRWGTDFIPGRLRFVTEPSPTPAYVLTRPQVLVAPHHGTFHVQLSVEQRGDGPVPTEVALTTLTGRQRGETSRRSLAPDDIGRPISLAALMSEPGMGVLRFQLLRNGDVTDTLVVPIEIESALPRFSTTEDGSMDCYLETLTVRPGETLEGMLAFVPARPEVRGRVSYRVEPIETVGTLPAPTDVATVELGGDQPLVLPLRLDVANLPCGKYRLAGSFDIGGHSQPFESAEFNIAGNFMSDYDRWMTDWAARVGALKGRQVRYPFQLEWAEMALHMLGRHGPEALARASAFAAQRRPWWAINWAVQLHGMLEALEQDRDYLQGRSGIFLAGYRSKVDGTLQPYEITLPEGYDRSGKWPVMFAHHGSSSHYYYSLIALTELGYQPITKWPVICVGLDGRAGPTPQNYLADVDFFEVYDQLRDNLGMDTGRVYMTGYSRGGMATWFYATQLPHLFAAVSPTAPFGYASTGQLPNMRHVAANSYHGVHDPRTAHGNSVMIGVLNSLGGAGYHMSIRTAGHDLRPGYRDRSFMERLLQHTVPAYPSDVEFVCVRPRYSRAYWVNIDRMIDYERPAKVKVNVVGLRTIRVETSNVGALTLDLSGGQVATDRALRIVLNGQEQQVDFTDSLTLTIEPVTAGLLKTPNLGGPIADWVFDKSVVVYGTQASDGVTEEYRKIADNVSAGVQRTGWLYVHETEAEWSVKADTEVTAEDVRDANLILLGGPGANSITSRIAEGLPVGFGGDSLTVGDMVVRGADAEVVLIYPNPENPQRYVVVLGVADPEIVPSTSGGAFKSLTADLMIVRGTTENRVPGRLRFDAQWKLPPLEALCEVPAGGKLDWREVQLDATMAQTGCDIAFRLSYDRARPVTEGPLYYADFASGVGENALVSMTMTGAEFEAYLQNWITFYGNPPLLRGIDLQWSIDPASHVARIEKTGLGQNRQYTIVSDNVSITRPTWAVPEHVQYRLMPLSAVEAAVAYLQETLTK